MKTPPSQEAAKMWAKEKAKELWRQCWDCTNGEVIHAVREDCSGPNWDRETKHMEAALLEADKNGYERGRKDSGMYLCAHHDSPACKECIDRLREFEENAFLKKDEALLRECFKALNDWWDLPKHPDEELLDKLKSRFAPSGSLATKESANSTPTIALTSKPDFISPGESEFGGHMSDCAVHNEPAYPKGDCDCKRKAPSVGLSDAKEPQ